MSSLLTELFDNAQRLGLGSCGVRFFTPTGVFWELLADYPESKFIELGAGRGDTTAEAKERGLTWSGFDLHVDSANLANGVMPCNALSIPVLAGTVYIIPRPDHSGWCQPTIERIIELGGTVMYVGLERNVSNDIWNLLDEPHTLVVGVGEEGECAWVFNS